MKKSLQKKDNFQILIYGHHPVFAVLKAKKRKVYDIFVLNTKKQEFQTFLKNENISIKNVNYVNIQKLDSIFPYKEKNHQGYILFSSSKNSRSFDSFLSFAKSQETLPKLLILDQIIDPHNFGAIIRTCVAFDVKYIIITSLNSVKDTSTVIKTSAGMTEFIDIIEVVNLNNTIKDLKNIGYFIIGMDGSAKTDINQIKNANNTAIVMGNEGKGIRELVKKNCDNLVKIPMSSNSESLNVSVATGITIYELWRK